MLTSNTISTAASVDQPSLLLLSQWACRKAGGPFCLWLGVGQTHGIAHLQGEQERKDGEKSKVPSDLYEIGISIYSH